MSQRIYAWELAGDNLGDQITFTHELATVTGLLSKVEHYESPFEGRPNRCQLVLRGEGGHRWIGHIDTGTEIQVEPRNRDEGTRHE